jgi:hypothetical protein
MSQLLSRGACPKGVRLRQVLYAMVIAWTGVTPARAWAQSARARVRLRLDPAEAVATLALLSGSATDSLPGADWKHLLAADGYRRLKARELAMGRPFGDSAF